LSLEQFFEKEEWGSGVEKERRLRIQLSVAAYAYEYCDTSIISDAEFDKMCMQVNLMVDTGNKVCDNYFKRHFNASTGQWIRKHPELKKIAKLYTTYYKT
jgi:hypothetical protein